MSILVGVPEDLDGSGTVDFDDLRARRGLCPACAYPVGEAAVCTECGKAVSSRRRSLVT